MDDLARLQRLLGILQEYGVLQYKQGDMELVLTPRPPALPAVAPPVKPPQGEDDFKRWADELEANMEIG